MPGCSNGNVWRQAFALSHHQKVVPLGLFLWSLQLSRLHKHWHSSLLPAPGKRKQCIKAMGKEMQAGVEELTGVAGNCQSVCS